MVIVENDDYVIIFVVVHVAFDLLVQIGAIAPYCGYYITFKSFRIILNIDSRREQLDRKRAENDSHQPVTSIGRVTVKVFVSQRGR